MTHWEVPTFVRKFFVVRAPRQNRYVARLGSALRNLRRGWGRGQGRGGAPQRGMGNPATT